MKEYLRKNQDGVYILELSCEQEAKEPHAEHWIEIPEGADICANHENGKLYFWKNDGVTHWVGELNKFSGNNQKYTTLKEFLNEWPNSKVVWSRHTHPEELPFVDDKPSLNDQYAEIEKVRKLHRTASDIADAALKHIRERASTYDQPTGERSASKTAQAFNAITGKDITESEVWLMLQLLKDVRQWSREEYHQDSAEDCIAYAALKAESLERGI